MAPGGTVGGAATNAAERQAAARAAEAERLTAARVAEAERLAAARAAEAERLAAAKAAERQAAANAAEAERLAAAKAAERQAAANAAEAERLAAAKAAERQAAATAAEAERQAAAKAAEAERLATAKAAERQAAANAAGHPADGPEKDVPVRELLGLANPGKDYPPATEAIRYLLQVVGRDVVSFRRNTQVSYMFMERARVLVNAINKYIEKVANSTSSEPDWDSFMKFTAAIEPMEDILFKLLGFTENEKEGHFSRTQSVLECIASVEGWARNRKELLDALETVDTSPNLANLLKQPNADPRKAERREAQSHDDRTLLIEIKDAIDNLVGHKKFPAYVSRVRNTLETLQTKVIDGSHPDWMAVLTVQTSMLVHGVLEISRTPGFDAKVRTHLRSKEVWTDAFNLVEALEKDDESQDTLPGSIKEKYDTFIRTLQGACCVILPQSYVDLVKQAGRIRRPFQAQAFAFVILCHALAQKFTEVANSLTITDENIASIESAFTETLAALKTAEGAVTELKNFDLSNFSQDTTFSKAKSVLEESFKSLKLDAEWSKKHSGAISSAFEKDMACMTALNNSFKKVSHMIRSRKNL
ncbi:hypothetical protein BGW80DRAFT_606890 [Lactifluus volemus]|nr:hypothetical protein BGW80DRAFT_606890 [Lactifluus volemus]